MTIALIDGDIVCYRSAASCEPNQKGKVERESLEIAIARCDDMMNRILNETGSNDHKAFISGPVNFRYKIDPNYKANRQDVKRPKWLEDVRGHLVRNWGAQVSDGIEADDNLGIHQGDNTILCSIDKDLLQIPGQHYNFVSGTPHFITEHQGWVNFFTQLIMGDRSDNIPGYDGKMRQVVPKFLESKIEALHEAANPNEMFDIVEEMYHDYERMMMNCHLLYILRKEGDEFHVPA